MLESIIEYLSPLTCQIDEYYICIKQGGKYPEENRKIIEDKFDFFEIESTDFDFLDETQKRYIKKLEERINTLLNNDTAIDKITMYSFSFIDMYANYYEV